MKQLNWVLGLVLALGAAVALQITAQNGGGPEGGGGRPGGSAFSTQYNAGGSFGGTGPGTSGFVLTSRGAGLSPTFQAVGAPTGAALTRVDDTNVTLTLGGSPTTALLNATSLTLGWSGTLAASRGGFVLAGTVTDDTVAVANGTTWQSKAIGSCSGASNALTYNTSTNAFGCNTITGGVSITDSGTGSISWDDGCTTTPTQSYSYVVTSDHRVSIVLGPMNPTTCTSDSTNMRATSTSTLPASIRPSANQYITGVYMRDNSGNTTGCLGFATTGILDAVPNDNSGCPGPSWTASGNKSVGFDRTVTIMYSTQ